MSDWQEMETAPKDGTTIMLRFADGSESQGFWSTECGPDESPDWYELECHSNSLTETRGQPVAWRPL